MSTELRVESNSGVGLPSGFESMPMIVPDSLYQRSPYVLFVHPRGGNFAELKAAIPSLVEGDPVLVIDGQPPQKLDPLKFILLRADRYFAQVDATGAIRQVTRDVEKARKGRDWKDHYETVLLVLLPDRVVPARCTFKTTKTNAIANALKALARAQTPEWANESAAHKATLAIPDARFRFVTTVTLRRGTGQTSGVAYTAANGFVNPLSSTEWSNLSDALADDDLVEQLTVVNEEFDKRLMFVATKE